MFAANAAWLVLAVIAFNLTRAAATLTDGDLRRTTTGTIRRMLITVPARVATSARWLTCTHPRPGPGKPPGPRCSPRPPTRPPPSRPDHPAEDGTTRGTRGTPRQRGRSKNHPPQPSSRLKSALTTTGTPHRWIRVQWFADGSPIPGADDDSYTPVPDDEGKMLSLTVTASAAGYDTTQIMSAELGPAPQAPVPLTPGQPTVSGSPTVGSRLTADPAPGRPGPPGTTNGWRTAA